MTFEEGNKDFRLELYRPGYIQEDRPSMDTLILSAQMFIQSEKIERFLHVHGDVQAIHILEFKQWLEKIFFHSAVETEYYFDPSLSFNYLGLKNSFHQFSVKLAFINSEYFERFNFCPYPEDVFKDDEFTLDISVDDDMLSIAIEELSNNFKEELEEFTGKKIKFL